jgi:hypothetical protein
MRRILVGMRRILALICMLALSGAAGAQMSPPLPLDDLKCDHFKKNDNGTWSVTEATTITTFDGSTLQLLPNETSFGRYDIYIGGRDLTSLLQTKCAGK